MTIYINPFTFQCSPAYNEGYIEFETDLFNGKCKEFIEGYRLIPKNMSWTRADGRVFRGQVMMPWRPLDNLIAAQSQYEKAKLEEYESALQIMGVEL